MACEEDIAQQEYTFAEALQSAQSASVEENTLYIHYRGNVELVFDRIE